MNGQRIAAIVQKDLIDAIRTPRLLLIIITPLIVALFINIVFGNKLTINIGIYAPDSTQIAAILEQVDLVRVILFEDKNLLQSAIRNKSITTGIILPQEFDTLLLSQNTPHVEILLADNSQESKLGLSLFQQAIQQLVPKSLPVELTITTLDSEQSPNNDLRGTLSIDQYAIVLWLVMGIVGNSVMLVPSLIVEERERQTLDALLLSPATFAEIIAAKAAVGVCYSLIGSAVILAMQRVNITQTLLIIMLVLLGSFTLSLIGVMIGVLSNNIQTLNSYGNVFVFILMFPSLAGMIGNNPILSYTRFLPTYSLTQGISQILTENFHNTITNSIIIAIQTLLIFSLVIFVLHRQRLR